jgi:hypothetical protein
MDLYYKTYYGRNYLCNVVSWSLCHYQWRHDTQHDDI